MSDLINRLTTAHQMATGQMENAGGKAEHERWKGLVRLLEDARDALTKTADPMRPTLRLPIVGKVN